MTRCPTRQLTGTPTLAQTIAQVAHKWLDSYNATTGAFTQSQPACSDLSNAGTLCTSSAALAQAITQVAHKWLDSYNATTGAFTQSQPACADLSNAAASCSTDATNAANITSGTLPIARLSGLGTAKQILTAGSPPAFIDFPDIKVIPAASCTSSTAGAGWDLPATNAPTVACRVGTNNLGGVLQWANNNATANAQFSIEIPADWDTAAQPYIAIYYGSGSNTTGTVKWTFATACSKNDGSVTDDPAFNSESATAGKTMAAANRMWSESIQFTLVTSANNCAPGANLIVKITSANGTATSTVNVSKAVMTFPRLLSVQAN